MTEGETAAAIGRAIQASDASNKKLAALSSEISRISGYLKSASLALYEVKLKSAELRIHDLSYILNKLPDAPKIRALVDEYEETLSSHRELEKRLKALRGLP